jgi:hypothetical protein
MEGGKDMALRSMGYRSFIPDHTFLMEFHGTLVQYGPDDLFYETSDTGYDPLFSVMLRWAAEGTSVQHMTSTGMKTHGHELWTDRPVGGTEPEPEPEPEPERERHTVHKTEKK